MVKSDEIRYNGTRIIDLSKKTLIKLVIGLWQENMQMKQHIDNQNLGLIVRPQQKDISQILKMS